MSKLLQIGMSTAAELGSRYGHIACTLDGVNYECRGGRGCLKGSEARGATNPLFRHRFHRRLTDAQAARAKADADRCVGQPYVLGAAPNSSTGQDCSSFMSRVCCKALGLPLKRLFTTATWLSRFDDPDLRFSPGLGIEEDDLTKDELLDALNSPRGQKILRKAVNDEVTHVLRVATSKDDDHLEPASNWFNGVRADITTIKNRPS
jgi:hypothetical protein